MPTFQCFTFTFSQCKYWGPRPQWVLQTPTLGGSLIPQSPPSPQFTPMSIAGYMSGSFSSGYPPLPLLTVTYDAVDEREPSFSALGLLWLFAFQYRLTTWNRMHFLFLLVLGLGSNKTCGVCNKTCGVCKFRFILFNCNVLSLKNLNNDLII